MVVENQYPTRSETPSPFGCGYAALCLLVNFQKPKVEWTRIVHGFPIPEPIDAPPLAG